MSSYFETADETLLFEIETADETLLFEIKKSLTIGFEPADISVNETLLFGPNR